jgi:hypothetical protein
VTNAELELALEELELRLERLRALYEQYFLGIERIEPQVPRKDVERRIYTLRREKIRNTARRYKLQTIIQRFNTFQQYWQRICREIENGTYKRHLLKAERIAPEKLLTIAARRRLGRRGRAEFEAQEEGGTEQPSSAPPSGAPAATPPPSPAPTPRPTAFEALSLDMEFLGDWDPAQALRKPGPKPKQTVPEPVPIAPRRPPPPAVRGTTAPPSSRSVAARAPAKPKRAPTPSPPAAPAGPAAGSGGLSEERVRELHARLVEMKRETKDSGKVSVEGLAKSLKATEAKLREQHKNRNIDFDIVIRNGKAVVKPIVR